MQDAARNLDALGLPHGFADSRRAVELLGQLPQPDEPARRLLGVPADVYRPVVAAAFGEVDAAQPADFLVGQVGRSVRHLRLRQLRGGDHVARLQLVGADNPAVRQRPAVVCRAADALARPQFDFQIPLPLCALGRLRLAESLNLRPAATVPQLHRLRLQSRKVLEHHGHLALLRAGIQPRPARQAPLNPRNVTTKYPPVRLESQGHSPGNS